MFGAAVMPKAWPVRRGELRDADDGGKGGGEETADEAFGQAEGRGLHAGRPGGVVVEEDAAATGEAGEPGEAAHGAMEGVDEALGAVAAEQGPELAGAAEAQVALVVERGNRDERGVLDVGAELVRDGTVEAEDSVPAGGVHGEDESGRGTFRCRRSSAGRGRGRTSGSVVRRGAS